MKKVICCITVLFIISCATTQQSAYVIPNHVKSRPILLIHQRLYKCYEFTEGNPDLIRIANSSDPNAWVGNDNIVVITEGFFKYSDEVLATVVAHELAHIKLNHLVKTRAVSIATTSAFVAAGFFVPYVGMLNHVVNPAVTNNYSKAQEYEADKLASETLTKCFKFTIAQQVHFLQSMDDGSQGGFWSSHPAWKDRIEAIKQPKAPE